MHQFAALEDPEKAAVAVANRRLPPKLMGKTHPVSTAAHAPVPAPVSHENAEMMQVEEQVEEQEQMEEQEQEEDEQDPK